MCLLVCFLVVRRVVAGAVGWSVVVVVVVALLPLFWLRRSSLKRDMGIVVVVAVVLLWWWLLGCELACRLGWRVLAVMLGCGRGRAIALCKVLALLLW